MLQWNLFFVSLAIILAACENPGPVKRGYVISESHPDAPPEAIQETITAWELVGEEPPKDP